MNNKYDRQVIFILICVLIAGLITELLWSAHKNITQKEIMEPSAAQVHGVNFIMTPTGRFEGSGGSAGAVRQREI